MTLHLTILELEREIPIPLLLSNDTGIVFDVLEDHTTSNVHIETM